MSPKLLSEKKSPSNKNAQMSSIPQPCCEPEKGASMRSTHR